MIARARARVLAAAALAGALALPARAATPEPDAAALAIARLRYMTEVSPPDNFLDPQGRPVGLFLDVLHQVWAELGVPAQPVEVLPWARAYERLQDTPGTVLFSVARLPEREALFRWAGPVRTGRFILFGKARRGLRLERPLPGAQPRWRVGTVISDAGEKLMLERGWELRQLDRAESFRSLMLKLLNDRVDLVAYGEMPALSYMGKAGIDAAGFEVYEVLSSTQLWFGFHRDTPPEVVARFQRALDAVKQRPGALPELFRRYGVPPEPGAPRPRPAPRPAGPAQPPAPHDR